MDKFKNMCYTSNYSSSEKFKLLTITIEGGAIVAV